MFPAFVGRNQVKMPGVPSVVLGVKDEDEVLKANVEGGEGLGFELVLLLERQRDSRAAPVWQVERVEFLVSSAEVTTR